VIGLLLACTCAAEDAEEIVLLGTCDASAAVRVGHLWVVASDEDDVLRVYDPAAPGRPVQEFDLDAVRPVDGERDIEAAIEAPEGVWWVGSLGRKADGDDAPGRRHHVLTAISSGPEGLRFDVGEDRTDLLDRMRVAPEWQVVGPDAERLPPKEGGLNLEGAAAAADGTWWLGLRSPLDGTLAILAELPPGRVPRLHPIDLEGTGVRDLVRDGDGFLLLSGPSGEKGVTSAVWSWAPGTPIALQRQLPGDIVPEALVRDAVDRWWVLSDDGRRRVDGRACKDLPAADRRFRARRLVD
jgi:hypothetical protein